MRFYSPSFSFSIACNSHASKSSSLSVKRRPSPAWCRSTCRWPSASLGCSCSFLSSSQLSLINSRRKANGFW